MVGGGKGSLADKHLVEKNPKGPEVQGQIVGCPVDHLRSQVVGSPAVGVSGLELSLDTRPAKIA